MATREATPEQAFHELTEPYRRELGVHCYRIVGSAQDAEDLVQETLLAAWRGWDGFERRSSVRTWLYRIATNRSLNHLRDSGRRPLAGMEFEHEPPPPTRIGEPLWLQPLPDTLIEHAPDAAPGPDARYEQRETVALAFVTALQRLPARQRAVLVLRDALGFSAAETAEILATTDASVNSALQRARATFEPQIAQRRERAPLPRSARERAVVGRFADAFEHGDVDAIVALLTDDAWLTMPPEPLQYQGPATIGRFLATVPAGGRLERFRLVPTRANGEPAFGVYLRDEQCAVARGSGIVVITLEGDRISAITAFHDTAVFPLFGLPRTLPA